MSKKRSLGEVLAKMLLGMKGEALEGGVVTVVEDFLRRITSLICHGSMLIEHSRGADRGHVRADKAM